MKIRTAIRNDIPRILEISRLFFTEQAVLQPRYIRGAEYEEQFLLDTIGSDKSAILLVEEEVDRAIGFALVMEKETPPHPCVVWYRYAYLMDIVVEPEYRNKGVGTKLLREIKEWARLRDLAFVQLNVLAENGDAKRLYERNGFRDAMHTLRCEVERLPLREAVDRVLFNNDSALELYYSLLSGGELWDGLPHRLYFDSEKRTVLFRRGVDGESSSTPPDSKLCLLHQTCEIKQVPREDLFDPDNDSRSLKNYGYDEWREDIRRKITVILEK